MKNMYIVYYNVVSNTRIIEDNVIIALLVQICVVHTVHTFRRVTDLTRLN